ncbi:SGF29 tudor-like domain-containing protein [Phellopilus nigrolimitatus]|nr:SGF29 tudor-like domain-containing protein [Phellopilus nigrolimitatus]
MDRRRALAQRPASSEEIQCWAHAAAALSSCRDAYNNPGTLEAMARVNRSISAWPSMSGENGEPMEAFETVKDTYRKLSSGLNEIKDAAEVEAKAIDGALEALSVLIAIRRAPENPLTQGISVTNELAGSSPLSAPATPVPTPVNKITLNVKSDRDRASEGPMVQPQPYKNDAKSRNRFYAKQLPLQEGRKVAFHPPTTGGGEADENTWILAVVTKCQNHEKHRYEVQDAEPQEDGQPGQRYSSNLKTMMPLPDPDAPPNSPSHPNAYPVFGMGSTVMALYPDTSCFYRAEVTEVIAAPREGRLHSAKQAYRLRFEDDDDQVHTVAAQWVVEWPGS